MRRKFDLDSNFIRNKRRPPWHNMNLCLK